ncbi:MAG TPA: hypothetical protein VJB57_04065 [Dehalococcoidia bacterium]|nr:hypothetical protein [Dehalococcoidia bacterium]
MPYGDVRNVYNAGSVMSNRELIRTIKEAAVVGALDDVLQRK